jgi:hypothetical protein
MLGPGIETASGVPACPALMEPKAIPALALIIHGADDRRSRAGVVVS